MHVKRLIVSLLIGIFLLISLVDGNSIRGEQYSKYYYQKKSLYQQLPNNKLEIIMLGDSITDGCNWAELFQDIRLKNRGISGDTTNGVLDRLDEVTESLPLKIFLMIGINDLGKGLKVDDVLNNIKRIIRQIKNSTPDSRLYIQSLLPVNPEYQIFPDHVSKTEEILSVNKGLKKICQHDSLNYIDLHIHFIDEKNHLKPEYTNDGLHLTGTGYILWKSLIEKYIKS